MPVGVSPGDSDWARGRRPVVRPAAVLPAAAGEDEGERAEDSEKVPHVHGTVARPGRFPAPCGRGGRLGSCPDSPRPSSQSYRGAFVPDLLGPDVRLLFVGINPGLWTAATQTHFAHPVNRFYPALLKAGIIDRPIDQAAGMDDDDRDYLRSRGIGITNLVRRATARADELDADELREGGERLARLVAETGRRWSRSSGSRRTAGRSGRRRRSSAASPRTSPARSCGWCRTRAG